MTSCTKYIELNLTCNTQKQKYTSRPHGGCPGHKLKTKTIHHHQPIYTPPIIQNYFVGRFPVNHLKLGELTEFNQDQAYALFNDSSLKQNYIKL